MKVSEIDMAIAEMGSFVLHTAPSGDVNILDLIYDDITAVTEKELTRKPLRHITIYGEEDDVFEVNSFPFTLRSGSWSSPSNNDGTLLEIRSIKPITMSGETTIYYIR
jgi:hypothetical protein